MLHTTSARRSFILAAISLTLLNFAHPAAVRADYATQTIILDQSNALKDGVSYGSVLVETYNGVGAAGGGLKAGEVRLTYTAGIVADYSSLSDSFGISHVGFSSDLSLKGKIVAPTGWKLNDNKSLDGFGKFTWNADGSGKGATQANPVTLLITVPDKDATLEHFLFGSTSGGPNPPPEGSVYFAMFVAGFSVADSKIDGHFVGGSTKAPPPGDDEPPPPGGSGEVNPTPEPSTLVLGGISLGCVSFFGWSARRRKQGA